MILDKSVESPQFIRSLGAPRSLCENKKPTALLALLALLALVIPSIVQAADKPITENHETPSKNSYSNSHVTGKGFYFSSFVTTLIKNFFKIEKPETEMDKKNEQKLELDLLLYHYTQVKNGIKKAKYFEFHSKKIAQESTHVKEYAFEFANYSTKLLIAFLNKNNPSEALIIIDNYLDNLVPFSGLNKKSSDVASNGLVLGIITKNEVLNQKIFHTLLGENFKIDKIDNDGLLYNLSCYYATHKEKSKMLQAIRLSLFHSKKQKQFFSDKDFNAYLEDEDFLAAFKLTKPITLDTIHFELNVRFSNKKMLTIDTRLDELKGMEEGLPLYELLNIKKMDGFFVGGSKKKETLIFDNLHASNIENFLAFLKKSERLSLKETIRFDSGNKNPTLMIRRETNNRITIFNFSNKADIKNIMRNKVFSVDRLSYIETTADFIDYYESLQESLNDHVQQYLNKNNVSNEHKGLRLTLLSSKLLQANKKNQLLEIEVKNVSDKNVFLIDNFSIDVQGGKEIYISVKSSPKEDAKILELKPNKAILMNAKVNVLFAKNIKLSLKIDNTYAITSKHIENPPGDEEFKSTYSGYLSFDISIFSIRKTWQKDVGTAASFEAWISDLGKF